MSTLIQVEPGTELEQVRALFLEYARSLDFNLCFQSFEQELRDLPRGYVGLYLCRFEGEPAGCIALKELEPLNLHDLGVSAFKH